MTLTIDDQPCTLDPNTKFAAGYDADTLRSPAKARQGDSLKLTIPQCLENDKIFRTTADFNAQKHTAELACDGVVLHRGTIRLLATQQQGYTIEIRGGAAQWAKNAAKGTLTQIELPYSGYMTPTDIVAGWTDQRPVKFLPVVRDAYKQQNDPTDLQPTLIPLVPDDYFPFIRVEALFRAIFTNTGYKVESKFAQTPLFKSLYISGAYPSRDISAVDKRMGFCAVRLNTTTATADSIGRVYATPYGFADAVGNIVESAAQLIADESGTPRSEAYNNGNCFGMDGSRIVYRPLTSIAAGFEFHIRYTTQHRILSREKLRGFNGLNLGTGGNITIGMPNRYVDRRKNLTSATSYRVIVFDAQQGQEFRLRYTANGNIAYLWTEFTGRSAIVSTPSSGTYSNPALYVRSGASAWTLWQGDWALYDGHIGETGQTTVELNLRTPAENIGPATPKYFNTIFFYGADPGMKLTLHPQCTVRPLFTSAPAYGSRITLEQVASHPIRQIELIEALQHLFNLRFYTDEQTKTVYIEPRDDFWNSAQVADWTRRTDFSKPIVWQDAALEVHDSRVYGYQTADGVSARMQDEKGLPFGAWRAETPSYAAIEGEEARINPLFCPTINATHLKAEAPSAWLMQVGDRDDPSGDNINFAPRIVRYCGLRELPAGERWNAPSSETAYPLAAFHLTDAESQQRFTLCFDNRDGLQGLHSYYDREETINSSRRHVTLSLRMEPAEYEGLFTMGSAMPDIRCTFLISTDEGVCKATLRRIEEYDPKKTIARCTFTLLHTD